MQRLQHEPPRPLVALQSRLAALYPEFDIAHLPVGTKLLTMRRPASADRSFPLLGSQVHLFQWTINVMPSRHWLPPANDMLLVILDTA